jgi:hypothetical protein
MLLSLTLPKLISVLSNFDPSRNASTLLRHTERFAPTGVADHRKVPQYGIEALMVIRLAELFSVLGEHYVAGGADAVLAMREQKLLDRVGQLIGPGALEVLGGDLAETLAMSSLPWPTAPTMRWPVLMIAAADVTRSREDSPRTGWQWLTPNTLTAETVQAGHDTMLCHPHAGDVGPGIHRFLAACPELPAAPREMVEQ